MGEAVGKLRRTAMCGDLEIEDLSNFLKTIYTNSPSISSILKSPHIAVRLNLPIASPITYYLLVL